MEGNVENFQYQMVQIPPNIAVNAKAHRGNEAATHLQQIVDKYAVDGWEFYRIDNFGVNVQPGCLGALFGGKAQSIVYYVVTFRRRA